MAWFIWDILVAGKQVELDTNGAGIVWSNLGYQALGQLKTYFTTFIQSLYSRLYFFKDVHFFLIVP